MGKRTRTTLDHRDSKPQTLPPSPSHSFSSSSSSDFEFTISISPRKSSSALCPADELFYKGQLLPLHLSPRLSMVRTLLLASSSNSSSSDTSTTASRDSTGSSNDSQHSFNSELVLPAESCDSSRRASSVTEDEEFKRLTTSQSQINLNGGQIKNNNGNTKSTNKYFSLSRFSSVFKKDHKQHRITGDDPDNMSGSSVKRMSTTAKEVIRKYLKKVKPLYEKISQKQHQQQQHLQKLGRLMTVPANATANAVSFSTKSGKSTTGADQLSGKSTRKDGGNGVFSNSFSGNLRYPRRKSCISSCPSSIRSSPNHSGVLCRPGFGGGRGGGTATYADTSSMEELQSAIQGAIAHCKNSLAQNSKSMVSNEI